MKFRDLMGIFPDSTCVTLFVDNMYYATEELASEHFKRFKNADIVKAQVLVGAILTLEISTLDLEA